MTKSGFGLAPIKSENTPFIYDDGEFEGRYRVGEPSTYMELCLKKSYTREQIHKIVDEWLDEEEWWKP